MNRTVRILVAALLLSSCGPRLPEVRLGAASLRIEIVSTPEARARGLSGRTTLRGECGMLFVFPEEQVVAFWMKDTTIPLSIAFLDARGRILGIEDMEPMSEERHGSPGPVKYALEANKGWFAARGVRVGDRAELPPLP